MKSVGQLKHQVVKERRMNVDYSHVHDNKTTGQRDSDSEMYNGQRTPSDSGAINQSPKVN